MLKIIQNFRKLMVSKYVLTLEFKTIFELSAIFLSLVIAN